VVDGSVELRVDGAPVPIHLSNPVSKGRPLLLVVHDRWGFDRFAMSVVDHLGAAGFVAAAAGLFEPPPFGHEDEADKQVDSLAEPNVRRTLGAALDLLRSVPDTSGRIGVLGFGMGGGLAMWLATQDTTIRACVAYAPTSPWSGLKPNFDVSHATFLGHYGSLDDRASAHTASQMEPKLRERGVDVTFETYRNAGAEFYRNDMIRSYDVESADLAWSRTVAFFKRAI
jgi:carboxymethylenebutenolidase